MEVCLCLGNDSLVIEVEVFWNELTCEMELKVSGCGIEYEENGNTSECMGINK